jgi:hypothetical protein
MSQADGYIEIPAQTDIVEAREAVRRYVEETGLPFNILIDETRDVSRAYGVWHRIGLDAWNTARPAVFLIEVPDGSILVRTSGSTSPAEIRSRVPVTRGHPGGNLKNVVRFATRRVPSAYCRCYLNRLATASQLTVFHQAVM